MSMMAGWIAADDSADFQLQLVHTIRVFDFAGVIAMDIHSFFPTAGAGKLHGINGMDQIVIVSLRDIRYHKGKNNDHDVIVRTRKSGNVDLGGKKEMPFFSFVRSFLKP